jgi:digeranylgeranylglycerophospholipid reductase
MHDVIVVGAGPAGLRCAGLCERAGLDVAVVEKKPAIGRPVQCSGLVSRNIDRFLKVPDSCIEHKVKGALVHGPGGREIRLKKPGTAAYVIDREALDLFLAGQVKSGIMMGTVAGTIDVSSGVRVSTPKGVLRSRALLGCDGPSSVVRKHFGVKPHEMLQGIIVLTGQWDDSDFVELWLDRDICDGFLWRIPRGETVEYGMMGSRVKFDQLNSFFKSCDVIEKRAGLIPVGPPRTYFERTLLVGDSAGQTKPWSGGGVVYGLTCAGHAVKTLARCLESGDLSDKALSAYEKSWRAELGNPISMGMMGRELFKEMDNKKLGEFMDTLCGRDLSSLDMDFPAIGF